MSTGSVTALRRLLRLVGILMAALMLAAIVSAGLFYGAGGRWFVIQTPSMGEYAPVGTLVLSFGTALAGLRVGDTILFHPPTSPGETYFHRIVSIADGAVRTQGDINGTIDPWTVQAQDLIGGETARLVGAGWLIEGLPVLLVGGLLLQVLTRHYAAGEWRFPLRVLGWSLLVAAAVFLIKPFVRAVLLTQSAVDDVQTTILVPTGLLNISAQAVGGTTAILRPGQPGAVETVGQGESGAYGVLLTPHFGPVDQLVLIGICLVPLALCIVYLLRRPTAEFAETAVPGTTAESAASRVTVTSP